MLTLLPPSQIQTDLKSICGEIHFQTSNFYFVCVFCGSNIENFNEFQIHFENKHLNTFVNIKLLHETSTEALSNDEKLVPAKDNLDDPLDWNSSTSSKDVTTRSINFVPINLNNQDKFNDVEETPIIKNTLPTDFSDEQDSFENHKNDYLDALNFSGESETETVIFTDGSTIDSKVDWNKSFQPSSLKHHTKRPYKPRDKLNSCTYCGRTFRRRYQLDTHLNIHTGAKPHQCEVCGRQFRAVTTLQRHLITHEQRSIFICKFCLKSFTHKAALVSHESRHIQERNFSCDECEKKFYTLNQCDTHRRRVHNKSNELQLLQFACDLCLNRYRTASMLSTHKKRKHYNFAKYTCDKCQKKFLDPQQLKQHQSIHEVGHKPNIQPNKLDSAGID